LAAQGDEHPLRVLLTLKESLMRVPSLLAFALLAPAAARAGQTTTQIAPVRAAQISGASSATNLPGNEVFINDIDKRTPGSGTGLARVPASHVPTPVPNAIALVNPGFSGFLGLTHLDQRNAGTGAYANTQFSLEPPDQMLCVGNGFVLEGVNTALAVYRPDGTRLAGPTAFNQFLGLRPEVDRSKTPAVFGDFTSDPKCYFDPDLQRWFITILQLDIDPATGNFTGPSHVFISVSASADPTGSFNVFVIDTTDPDHPGCPCFGDQPLIGADANGFFVSTNEFPTLASGFNGPQIYAMSKQRLAAGAQVAVVHLSDLSLPDGSVFTIQPATTPKGGGFELGAGGTEYFLNSFFTGGLENRVVLWALSNTISLSKARPALSLTHTILDTEVFGFPPAAEQQPGPTPLGATVGGKLEFLDANDDRMNQVVFSRGLLWSALATPVKTPNSPTKAGIAWLAVAPSVASGAASGTVAAQGYISIAQENAIYPSIAVNAQGKAVATFTLVGPDFHPTAAYAPIDLAAGAGDVHIAAAGAAPEDGFTGYAAFGGSRVARWGDYSAGVADESGNFWLAAEFIPDAPRTVNANWGTFITRISP
jgi:hypothetical protein